MRIEAKLALFLTVLVALSIITISYFYTENAGTAISDRTDAQLGSIAMMKKNQLDQYLEGEIEGMAILAGDVAEESTEGHMATHAGESVESLVRGRLHETRAEKPDFAEFSLISLNGTVIVSTDAGQEGENAAGESYFRRGMDGPALEGRTSPPETGRSPVYIMAVPVKDENGNVTAVLAGRLLFRHISTIMTEPAGMGYTGEVFLVDKYGVPATALKKPRADASAPLRTYAIEQCMQGKGGSARYPDYNGDEVIGRYAWHRDIGMCMISKIDSSEALAPIREIELRIVLASAVLFIVSLAIAITILRVLLSPIEKLTKVVSGISKGDVGIELDPKLKESDDEIGQLARAFDRTLVSLKLAIMETSPELKRQGKELREALEERTRAEERYRALVKMSPDAVIVTDPNAVIVEVSSRTVEIFGARSASDLVGKDAYCLLPLESRERMRRTITRILNEKWEAEGLKLELQRDDGGRFTADVNIKRLRDAAGRHIGTILTMRDVTVREAADRELHAALDSVRKAEERYRTLMKTSPDAVLVTDAKGIITEVSDRAVAVYGMKNPSELLGKDAFALMAPDERAKAEKAIRNTLRKGGSIRAETYRLLKADGSAFFGEVTTRPLMDEEGRPAGFITMVRDVTRREEADRTLRDALDKAQKAEETLALERNRARRYLDLANVVMVAIGADQKVTLINRKGCELLGYNEKEILGKNWFDWFVPKKDRERTRDTFMKLMRGELEKEVEYYENEIVARNGQGLLIAWHNTLLREGGRITGTLSAGDDITEHRRNEEQLQKLNRLYSITQAVLHTRDMERIMDEVCRIAVEKGGLAMAWIGRLEAGGKTVMPEASYGFAKAFWKPVPLADIMKGRDPMRTAIMEGSAAAVNDWDKERGARPWAENEGYRSSAAFPMMSGGKIVGVLCLYSATPAFFDSETIGLFSELAADISFIMATADRKRDTHGKGKR